MIGPSVSLLRRWRAVPLLLWHGGGLTGVTYETKPDGGEGWLTYFMRQGWDSYISDAVERGRSGWTSSFKGDPVFLPFGDPWERFRIGPPARVLAIILVQLRLHVIARLATTLRTHRRFETKTIFRFVRIEIPTPFCVMLALRIT